MGALPCTPPQFILLLVQQRLCIKKSFCSSFLSTSVSLMILSPLHPLTFQGHLGACPVLHSSVSSVAISPLMRPAFFSLKETPSEGSILEIQTSASPLPSCSVNIKESGGDVPAPTAMQPLTQMTKPDCQPPTG